MGPGFRREGEPMGATAMSFYEKGAVRIYFEEAGSGFPLLLIAGGGLKLDDLRAHRQLSAIQRDRGVQERVPLHRRGPAQRQWRSVLSRPA
jgi:hypothetical protein